MSTAMISALGYRRERLFPCYDQLLRRLRCDDTLSPQEFTETFKIFDPYAPGQPSLGVFIVIHHPYLLIARQGLRHWVRTVINMLPVSVLTEHRRRLDDACRPALAYTEDEAKTLLVQNPEFQELILRGMLMRIGLKSLQHWEMLANKPDYHGVLLIFGGPPKVAEIIVSHLRDADVGEVQTLLAKPNVVFDPSGLIGALRLGNRTLFDAASICQTRAPELFMTDGWRMELPPADMVQLVLRLLENGDVRLTPEQQETIMLDPHLPRLAQHLCWQAWRGDEEERK